MLRFACYWWVKIMENNLRRTEFYFFIFLEKIKEYNVDISGLHHLFLVQKKRDRGDLYVVGEEWRGLMDRWIYLATKKWGLQILGQCSFNLCWSGNIRFLQKEKIKNTRIKNWIPILQQHYLSTIQNVISPFPPPSDWIRLRMVQKAISRRVL